MNKKLLKGKIMNIKRIIVLVLRSASSGLPVSYTHLDVYKRQILMVLIRKLHIIIGFIIRLWGGRNILIMVIEKMCIRDSNHPLCFFERRIAVCARSIDERNISKMGTVFIIVDNTDIV